MDEWNTRFNGPVMTEEQLTAYLTRIGLTGPIPLTLEGLSMVQRAHQQTVPFENIGILTGKPLTLEHGDLFDKIIRRRQGGVCAELNTIYNWLLYSLGFTVRSFNSRILTPFSIFFRRHRVLCVTIDGVDYTTDVGVTTEAARTPLLLKEGVIQEDGSCRYRYEKKDFFGWVQYQQKPGQDWTRFCGFTEEPQMDGDFEPILYWFMVHPDSNMNKVVRCSLYTSDTEITAIRNGKYLVEERGLPVEERELEPEEGERLARELFGLEIGCGKADME